MHEWLLFACVMAVGQFSPGPDMILLTRTALARGRGAGCWTAIGIACGLAFHAAIAVAGVAVLINQNNIIQAGMRWLAAGYLVWLAWQLMMSFLLASDVELSAETESESGCLSDWRRGFLCNIFNPKVAVFLAGVTAPFLLGRDGWQWPAILWATIVLEGVLLWCLWVCLLQAETVRSCYRRAARWFDLAFAIALLAVACALVVA